MARIDFRLCLITDRHQTGGRALAGLLHEAVSAGLGAVQLREKDLPTRPFLFLAQEIRDITKSTGTRLLVNGRLDVALAVGADGVHLPSDGLPVDAARRVLGREMLLGVSAHSVQEAQSAERGGADYVLLGPIFPTPSKEGYGPPLGAQTLERAARTVKIPIFAVGGIMREKVGEVLRAGASGVAAISALLGAEDVAQAVREMQEEIERQNQLMRGKAKSG